MSDARKTLIRNARSDVDARLGRAADALEGAARAVEELRSYGIEYPITGSGDVLTYARMLSRAALDLQVDVRKANHEA